jgi:hypothetical protein
MNLLAGAVAVALVATAPGSGAWVPGEHGGVSIHMSIVNWGEDVDISTPGHAAWAHLAADGASTHIAVVIDPGEEGLHGYYGRLKAPDANGGPKYYYCGDEFRRMDTTFICGFDVPMTRGLNHFTFDLQSASYAGMITAQGVIIGGSLDVTPVLEARQPDGSWKVVPHGGDVEMRGEETGALRYRLMNTGDIPFRAPSSCQNDGTTWPYQQLLCILRGPRPGFALAGDYSVPITLEDPAGGDASFVLEGRVVVPGVHIEPNTPAAVRFAGVHE